MIDRRQALCHLGVGLLGLYGCAGLATLQVDFKAGEIVIGRDEVEEALRTKGAVRIRSAGLAEDIALLLLEDGSLQALGMTCSHLGCQVRPRGGFLLCPCHGSTFDTQGEVVRGPAPKGLTRYPVAAASGQIKIYALSR